MLKFIILTDPESHQEFAIAADMILSVFPIDRSRFASGARTIVQTSIVQSGLTQNPDDSVVRTPVATTFACSERWSRVMAQLGYEASAAQIDAEQAQEEAHRASPIALPDTATLSNFLRKG